MKKWIVLLVSMIIAQNSTSDQGLDIVAEPGDIITLPVNYPGDTENENLSKGFEGNVISSYQWSVPQDILDANPGLDLQSETLSFTAPNIFSTTTYSITLEVSDSQGNASQEYDASDLILSE